MFGKKKSKKPQTESALMAEALQDLRHDQEVKARRRRRRLALRWPDWLDRRLALGVAALVVVLVADGVWRENQEFYARVTALGGDVWFRADDNQPQLSLRLKQRLEDLNTVQTGPTGWAELAFPDGSVVTLDSSTIFRVKRLEYHRAGAFRSRSFYVMAGRVFARVGENFGPESKLSIYSPACVAAVRGTRFSVTVDAVTGLARTVCGDGLVEVRGYTGLATNVQPTGDTRCVPGGGPTAPAAAPGGDLGLFRAAPLNQIIRPEPWYTLVGLTVTQLLDAPLNILGIGKCSWFVGSIDSARRSRCQTALRLIQSNLEGDMLYPRWVNPATLVELKITEPDAVRRILNSFDGAALESYYSTGNTYYITARARDRKRTRFELTTSVIREASDQQ